MAAGLCGEEEGGDGVGAEGRAAAGEGVDVEVSAALAEVHFAWWCRDPLCICLKNDTAYPT